MFIEFSSEEIEFSLPTQNSVASWINETCRKEKKTLGDLTYIFCSDGYLLEINKKYLNHDYFTDIITFNYNSANILSGDLFISIDRIKENAEQRQIDFLEELHRVMIHGILHLIGYNDKTPDEQLIMRQKEDYYLTLRSF